MESTNNYMETDLGNVSPNPKGTYDNATAYEYLDLVEYQGGSYLCTVDIDKKVKGISPTVGQNSETWQLVALPGTSTEEYVAKHTEVIEKAKQVETSRAAVELCKQEVESAQADVEQMRQDTQQAAQNASDANTEAQQAAQQAEASRSAAQTSEQNAAASRNLANTYKANAETAKSAAETAAQNATESKTAAETAAQNAAQSKADIDSIKEGIEEAAKGENVSQIQQNMNDISQLKESLSNKITKFYASNEGKNHLADSDNGKIMDMMLYGKSEQFTTTGKNLFKIKDGTQTTRGVTVTVKDGVFALKGTATETGWAILDIDSFVLDGTCILSSNITTNTRVSVANKSYKLVLEQNKSNTLENAEVSKVCFNITEGKTYDISNILIQIEKGSVATSYEPYTGGNPSPNPSYPQEIKSVVNPTVKVSNEDGTKSQTVTLPYTLNAIPVASNGNVTIDGQQYVSDYIDVERGKVVRCVKREPLSKNGRLSSNSSPFYTYNLPSAKPKTITEVFVLCNLAQFNSITTSNSQIGISSDGSNSLRMRLDGYATLEQYTRLSAEIIYELATPIEEDLTSEQIQSLQALKTKHPVTNIFITSDQLDGCTTFNYPISMANGWNYVKKQLSDNRDYIYDMDTTSAEAYVNSEYAVALTELEVM